MSHTNSELLTEEQEFLKQYNISDFDRPSITTDIVMLTLDKNIQNIRQISVNGLQVLLIKRGSHPYKEKWALPGGFCKSSETVKTTAKRELFEETGVSNIELNLVGTYSEHDRDPRGWIISNAFMGLSPKENCNLRADTDAWEAAWFTISNFVSYVSETKNPKYTKQEITHVFTLKGNFENKTEYLHVKILETRTIYPNYINTEFSIKENDLAFDHGQIICETYLQIRNTLKHDIRMLFDLFPNTFTIGELQKAYETIMQTKVQNFRRTIQPYVKETTIMADKAGYRPAKLYTRNTQTFITSAYM